MKKGLFSGWQDVFSFTFKQVASKKYQKVTALVGLLLLLVGMAVNVIMALVEKDDATKVSPIEVVHVFDESSLETLYLETFTEQNIDKYPNLSFVVEQGDFEAQVKKSEASSENDIFLNITHNEEGYLLNVVIPYDSNISKSEAESMADDFLTVMDQSKLLSSGIAIDKLTLAMSGMQTSYLDAGEAQRSLGEELISMLLPMLLIFLIYIMVFLYGQSMAQVVSVEKTSKLMEMLLTLTKPYGIITGKVLATAVTAIMQIFLWLICLPVGFFAGDFIARTMIYPEYNNDVIEALQMIASQEGSTAFSVGAIILAVLTICIAFFFYCVLAAMMGSFASKTEELGQTMAYYQIIMVLGFMGAYLGPLEEKPWINTALRIIPFTSAYLLPGDLIVGNVTTLQGVLYLSILLLATLTLILFAGKVYKNQLFYRGTSFKERLKYRVRK